MRRTLSTLAQLGVANASLLTVHFNPSIQALAEEIIIELVDEPIRRPYLELIELVEKTPEPKVEPLSKFAVTLISIASESEDYDEFRYLMDSQMRVYRLWRSQETDISDSNEQDVLDNSYRMASVEISGDKTKDWAEKSGTKLPMADCTVLAQTIYDALKDGSYFAEELYKREVEMSPDGSLRFADKANSDKDEDIDWPALFEDATIL